MLSLERRRRLLLLSQRYQTPIVEDDPYGELFYEQEPPQPLKALDTHDNVLYLSTFSKTLAPGLRVAWLAAPAAMIERISLHKQVFDLNTTALGQWLVSELLRKNLFDGHLLTLRQRSREKRDLMLQAIQRYWPTNVRVNCPAGGYHLWCRLPNEIRARPLLREAAQQQVAFVIGEPFHVDGGGHHYIRLSFAAVEERYIEEGIRRIGVSMKRIVARRMAREERGDADVCVEHLPMV